MALTRNTYQRNSTWNAPYTFSGKEKDAETGYGYFGARYYDSGLSFWISVDPMSDKYPSMSPYNYCANNPVILVDPDGRDNVIYLVYLGNDKNFTNRFVKYANQALKDMGLETSISIVKDPNTFDAKKMDKNDMLLVIGDCQKVKDYIKKVSPENFLWFDNWFGNTTFVKNPERATNSRKGATRNIVGIDLKDIGSQLKDYKVTLDYYLTTLTMHGMGHNAGMWHSDDYYNGDITGKQNQLTALIMSSGSYFESWTGKSNPEYPVMDQVFEKKFNSMFISNVKSYYGSKK
jgi:RHS repeat-associated protein